MSSVRHPQYILQSSLQDVLRRCLSNLRLRHLLDICKISWQDVLTRCLACLGKTSLRHLVDVFLPTGMVPAGNKAKHLSSVNHTTKNNSIHSSGHFQKQSSCSVEEVFLELTQNAQENTYTRVSFLIKEQALGFRPATWFKNRLWRRDFFLWILRNF